MFSRETRPGSDGQGDEHGKFNQVAEDQADRMLQPVENSRGHGPLRAGFPPASGHGMQK
jgi:hypothetical protein